jgi:hypothetical protein
MLGPMRVFSSVLFFLTSSLLLLFACKHSSPSAPDAGPTPSQDSGTDAAPAPEEDGGICASHHSGKTADDDPVEICDHPFATRPWVVPPPDDTSDPQNVTLYGTVSMFGVPTTGPIPFDTEPTFYDRTGTGYVVVDGSGQPLFPMVGFPAGFEMPSDRYLYLVYKVTGQLASLPNDAGPPIPTLHVATAAPAILVNGVAIDSQGLGAWEGTVSARIPDGGVGNEYDPSHQVRIRVSFTSTTPLPNFAVLGGDPILNPSTPTLPDGTRAALQGTVENFDQPVLAADGTCLPSLSSLGAESPVFDSTAATVQLVRYAGMHGTTDHVEVFTYPPHDVGATGLSINGMATMGFFDPQGLLLSSAAIAAPGAPGAGIGPVRPHSIPNGHVLTIHQVPGGGGSCTPGAGSGIETDAGTLDDDGGGLDCVGACGLVYCTPCVIACLGAASDCSDGG